VFATDREVLLPDALGALIVIAGFAREHPEKQLLVAGHTDSSGSDGHNRELSERRAENVRLWLAGDAEGWSTHCQGNFERADFKAVHAWAQHHLGWSTDPGELDNAWHGQARRARDVFRGECEAVLAIELEHDVAQNKEDWRGIHDLYSLIVARYLDIEAEDLLALRRSFRFCEPATLACGEDFPRDRPGQNNPTSATDRRVDVLFFDPDEQPQPGGSPPGAEIYAEHEYVLHELDPCDLDPLTPAIYEIHIELYDHWHHEPVADSTYRLSGPLPERLFQREGTTDGTGGGSTRRSCPVGTMTFEWGTRKSR